MSVEREFRQVLAEMELLSHGKTQSFNATARGENDNPVPYGEATPPHEGFAVDWQRCETDQDRQATLGEAKEFLESWKGRNRAQGDHEWDESAWILADGEGFDASEVAKRFNTTPSRVRKIRIAADRDSEYGLSTVPAELDKETRVLNLASKGCTVRQIALQTGVPKSTVDRLLRRRAA